jgi:predicted transglutaminase-like cysteine proteinase
MIVYNVTYRNGCAFKVLTTAGTEDEAITRRRQLAERGYPTKYLHIEKVFNFMEENEVEST